jgi:hypothetical protein
LYAPITLITILIGFGVVQWCQHLVLVLIILAIVFSVGKGYLKIGNLVYIAIKRSFNCISPWALPFVPSALLIIFSTTCILYDWFFMKDWSLGGAYFFFRTARRMVVRTNRPQWHVDLKNSSSDCLL